MGGVGGFHGDGGHVLCIALCDPSYLVKALSLSGCGCGDMVKSDSPCQSPFIVLAVGIKLDLLACDHLADIEACLLGQLHGLLSGQLVACVVERQQQNAVAFVSQLHGVKYQLRVGGRKNIAHRLYIQHSFSNKTSLCRLVAGAAVCNDGHAVCVL